LAGEGWGKGLGTTRGRFGALDRAVVAPVSSSPAAAVSLFPARQRGQRRNQGRGKLLWVLDGVLASWNDDGLEGKATCTG
jgi:hypothetical protein